MTMFDKAKQFCSRVGFDAQDHFGELRHWWRHRKDQGAISHEPTGTEIDLADFDLHGTQAFRSINSRNQED